MAIFKAQELPIGTVVYASLFASHRIGKITAYLDDQICYIDGKQTFISDIIWDLTKDWERIKNIKFLFSPADKKKIKTYFDKNPIN